MSRRKQPRPRQLRPEQQESPGGAGGAAEGGVLEEVQRAELEETHVCDKCCGEFFSWSELSEHVCSQNPLVLIVKDSEQTPLPLPEESSPPPSVASSMESMDAAAAAAFDLGESNDLDSVGQSAEEEKLQDKSSSSLEVLLPSTNVTLEILHSTRVAVAQFSQGVDGPAGKAASSAIPLILEHLLALQQQQVQQLQLIEQICSQVAVMNHRQPSQAALNPAPACRSPPAPLPPQILPLSGSLPSAAASLEKPVESPTSQTPCTSASSEAPAPASSLPPPYSGSSSSSSSLSCTPTLSASSPLLSPPPPPSSSSSSTLPFLPQSPPGSGVIFPNPLASIAATASALDPLAALMKHRKGKLPNVSLFESKPGPEEPFFKHKCRFCAKVFGSDSALQIHLRSHTGERPFKCNICGNRFSTKGNLKVHFQRHKEKYPHVEMNPYPVPEYLDNVPTSSGIPYGMSIPPEKPVSSWLESKPVVAALPATLGLPLASSLTSMGGSNDPVSVTASVKSPYTPAAFECVSLSPNHRGSEAARFSPVSESPQSNRETEASNTLRAEGVHLPQSCLLRPTVSEAVASVASTPEPDVCSSPPDEAKFPSERGLLDPTQTSETSKLQQLVENIDKKITDPNQCVLCHRVLSCQSALKMHYRVHTGERPYRCRVCGRAFTTKGNLKAHIGVHRENPPMQVQHSCPICQKKFTNAVVLQQHIRLHMVGQIPEMAALPEPDSDVSVSEKNFDSLSSNSNELVDEVSMEDDNEEEDEEEEEEEEVENMEDGDNSSKPLIFDCNSSYSVVSSITALENQMRMIDSVVKFPINSFNDVNQQHVSHNNSNSKSSSSEKSRSANSPNVSESSCSPQVDRSQVSPVHSSSNGPSIRSPSSGRTESREPGAAAVKRERPESPSSSSAAAELRAAKLCVKEEAPYSVSFQLSRDRGQNPPLLVTSTSSSLIKSELNGHGQSHLAAEGQQPPFSLHIPPVFTSVGGPAMTSLLGPAPARRTPKQHNCNVCGKNFSSASALQIHERTHTGEKPFVCSVCGRAFTTKGNLKVHMGTHMWNNAPARRGRRLSVENPMALLGGEAVKFGEMFQKDLAVRAMNVDPGFWNRYATAIANSLASKNNEISVIQNRGIAQLHPLTAAVERVGAAGSPISSRTKTGMDLGNNRHFSMLIDDSKEIGIN